MINIIEKRCPILLLVLNHTHTISNPLFAANRGWSYSFSCLYHLNATLHSPTSAHSIHCLHNQYNKHWVQVLPLNNCNLKLSNENFYASISSNGKWGQQNRWDWDFHGGPVVKTPCLRCGGPGLHPSSGNRACVSQLKILHAENKSLHSQIKKRKKEKLN